MVTGNTFAVEYLLPVSKTTYNDVSNSFLHIVVAQQNIFPYSDMIRWVIYHPNSIDRNFMTKRNTVIDSFTIKDLS